MKPEKVRFWIYWNSDYIKITVASGKDFDLYEYFQTEEGFTSEAISYRYDRETGEIRRFTCSRGRDCDGRLDRYYEDFCHFTELKNGSCGGQYNFNGDFVENPEIRLPNWSCCKSRQCDQYAELSGY